MKRPLTVAAALVAMSLNWLGLVSPIASARAPSPDVHVIVMLREQADLSSYAHLPLRIRRSGVVRELRDTATESQVGLLGMLNRERAAGRVADIGPLWIVNGIEMTATPSLLAQLSKRRDVAAIVPVTTVQAPVVTTESITTAVEPEIAKVNAPAMWNLGLTGQSVVVANMDTGVDVTHPDLASRWRGGTNSWYDPNGQHVTTPTDVSGHGTWTMGVMVGGSAGGSTVGMAPDAQWIAVKIFNDSGSATSTNIHRGFQWLLDPDGNPATDDAPDVVNDSWTTQTSACLLDFQPDLQSLRAAGIMPVFAAGNYGPTTGSSRSPANLPEALAVGSTNLSDVIATSSSRGPSTCAEPVYPQVVAPGVGTRTTDLYGGYIVQSGTSLAAPVVSGALALLLDALPNLPADRQQVALESTALDLGLAGADNAYGHGRLDVLAAYQWLLAAPDFQLVVSPSSVSIQPNGSVSFMVDVSSSGDFAGDVLLTASGLPAGVSAAFSPSSVTGSGSAQLTLSTDSSVQPGTYAFSVIGTSDALVRSASATLVVAPPPDFAASVAPSLLTVVSGGTGTATVSVSAMNGFAADVALTASGLPAEVGTATIAPAVVTVAGTSELTISAAANAPAGSYPVTITATSGSLVHMTSLVVQVPVRDFTISVTPPSASKLRRQSANYSVSIGAVNGFSGDVAFSASGLPPASTATFTPTHVVGSGSATLRIATTSATPRQTYSIRVIGTSGALVHDVTVALTVR